MGSGVKIKMAKYTNWATSQSAIGKIDQKRNVNPKNANNYPLHLIDSIWTPMVKLVNGDISIFGGFVHIYMQRHAFKM